MAGTPATTLSSSGRKIRRLGGLVYGIGLAGFLIQAITGFVPKLLFGRSREWWLLVHFVGAPLFIVGLTAGSLLWAERCRFRSADSAAGFSGARAALTTAQKLTFWIILVAGFVTMTSMLAAMLPVFGYVGQGVLLQIHLYGAIVLAVAVVAHWFSRLAPRGRKR